ncbi:hypothetical protein C0Z01_14180 [Photobacterium kishitanii]|uniref:hypothetical protein n=1 Tax=Photobacterium kishitanii TaxID=318456 RepID=UPI0007EFB348|nr:hypothetical protein [Photobacterium kishitanii]OBU24958.1 hypothetical protein AYY22_21025 [Photobacterium kishitanii]PSW68704.1 hypothetical protein C0Z01_14180 [Photobacterium kishitanii]
MNQKIVRRVDTTLENLHEYVIGGSGSGKSFYVKSQIQKAGRLLVFDPDDEYAEVKGIVTAYSSKELLILIKKSGVNGRLKVRYVANGKQYFDFVCAVAFMWGNCCFVAEEIADVTSTAKASENWGKVVRRGRKRGIKIFAVTQRPAEADKTIFTQVAKIRCGRLDGKGDKVRVAENMQCDVNLISNLLPLDFLEFNRKDGSLYAGHKQRRKNIRGKYGDLVVI